MPDDGVMLWSTVNTTVIDKSGDKKDDGSRAIHVYFDFPAGKIDGQDYSRFITNIVLPNTPEGFTALKMLKLGFERR